MPLNPRRNPVATLGSLPGRTRDHPESYRANVIRIENQILPVPEQNLSPEWSTSETSPVSVARDVMARIEPNAVADRLRSLQDCHP